MITQDRVEHQLAVAREVVRLAHDAGNYTEHELQELFVMGYLHDIGYEFAEEPDDHAVVGGEILKGLGFKFWKEVGSHGHPGSAYSSAELDILNSADMRVMPNGELGSYEERLQDIEMRYGKDSPRYRSAEAVVAGLRAKGL